MSGTTIDDVVKRLSTPELGTTALPQLQPYSLFVFSSSSHAAVMNAAANLLLTNRSSAQGGSGNHLARQPGRLHQWPHLRTLLETADAHLHKHLTRAMHLSKQLSGAGNEFADYVWDF